MKPISTVIRKISTRMPTRSLPLRLSPRRAARSPWDETMISSMVTTMRCPQLGQNSVRCFRTWPQLLQVTNAPIRCVLLHGVGLLSPELVAAQVFHVDPDFDFAVGDCVGRGEPERRFIDCIASPNFDAGEQFGVVPVLDQDHVERLRSDDLFRPHSGAERSPVDAGGIRQLNINDCIVLDRAGRGFRTMQSLILSWRMPPAST